MPDERRTPKPDSEMSSSDRIVKSILKGLYEGRFVAGQRLVEPDLVSQYEVSRSTVREAIKRLASMGVVEASLNRGARIRQLSKDEARNVLRIIEVIVGLAARLAAENITDPHGRAQVELALADLLSASKQADRYEFVRQRNRFNRTLARVSKNPELEQMLANLQVHLVRNRLVMQPEDRARSYAMIGAAVLAGDGDEAERQARAHVRRVVDMLDDVYVPAFIGAGNDD